MSSTEDEPRTTEPTAKPRRRRRCLILAVVLLLVGLAIGVRAWTYRADGTTSEAPVWTPDAPVSMPPSPTQLPVACQTTPTEFVPTSFTIDRLERSWEVLALGLDSRGAAAAPPTDRLDVVAWFDESPKAGSDQGKVLITAHTFANRVALGNELNEGLLQDGDIVRLTDAAGDTACYQYTNAAKIWVTDYDPESDAVYDEVGAPQIAIVVCADWNPTTRVAESRVIYYFRLLTPTAA